MRKSVLAPAGVTAAVALLTVGTPTASQALTEKELSVCYVDKTIDPVVDLEVVADGPSYKSASLDAGDCVAWDVRPGQYKIGFEDIEEFSRAGAAGFRCASDEDLDFEVRVKRMSETYKVSQRNLATKTVFNTDVKKDRRTAVTFLVFCLPEKDDP